MINSILIKIVDCADTGYISSGLAIRPQFGRQCNKFIYLFGGKALIFYFFHPKCLAISHAAVYVYNVVFSIQSYVNDKLCLSFKL